MFPLPMMHWPHHTWPCHGPAPLNMGPHCTRTPQALPPSVSDIWWARLETLRTKSLVLTPTGYWRRYGWQAGGTHPTRMLSCLQIVSRVHLIFIKLISRAFFFVRINLTEIDGIWHSFDLEWIKLYSDQAKAKTFSDICRLFFDLFHFFCFFLNFFFAFPFAFA